MLLEVAKARAELDDIASRITACSLRLRHGEHLVKTLLGHNHRNISVASSSKTNAAPMGDVGRKVRDEDGLGLEESQIP